jgi:hypothetical protein
MMKQTLMLRVMEEINKSRKRLDPTGEADKLRHPIQPMYRDAHCASRFKENAIVRFLLETSPFDLHDLARMQFSENDREQFAQLIGYSLSGFGELPYVSDVTYNQASTKVPRKDDTNG